MKIHANINNNKKQLAIFHERKNQHSPKITALFQCLYGHLPQYEEKLDKVWQVIEQAYKDRQPALKNKDLDKGMFWFLNNHLAGMSLYVDRFCGTLKSLSEKIEYFQSLGVNLLHLMPLMQSPENQSDGGYAVSNFKMTDPRFGTLEDLKHFQAQMADKGLYLMLDIVLNHTSDQHEWAQKAKSGHDRYKNYYYCYNNRSLPDQFDKTMPEVFPESSPGNFTWVPEMNNWVMTVFHHYQWDLNYTNPDVFVEMLENILFYANLGVDILRIDAPAFIWKRIGTDSQNLYEAHLLLRLFKKCVQVAAPGMALLGEAIVAPEEIMKYFGENDYLAEECDVAYNATQMALQWDALATADTRIMYAAQQQLLQKPYGTTWINYVRCHDDIGLGYSDSLIAANGFNPYEHRKFIKEYYGGYHHLSDAKGALFSVNLKTNDARISGSLASLCGLENALLKNDKIHIETALNRILLMQAQSIFIGGIPMIFYGDEAAYTNDYSYHYDSGKNYDNRWMHRPIIDWNKNAKVTDSHTVEGRIFSGIADMLSIRKKYKVFADNNNIYWLRPHNIHVSGFLRSSKEEKIICLFNYKNEESFLTWFAIKELLPDATIFTDLWKGTEHNIKNDNEFLILAPYQFMILNAK